MAVELLDLRYLLVYNSIESRVISLIHVPALYTLELHSTHDNQPISRLVVLLATNRRSIPDVLFKRTAN